MNLKKYNKQVQIPVTINQEWAVYWGEAILFPWCFSQWNSLKEYWDNMTESIVDYTEWIKEWFFSFPNTWILNINIDSNGRIENNFLKRVDKNSCLTLSNS